MKSLVEKSMTAGYNEIPVGGTWDGSDSNSKRLAIGVYLYRLTATAGKSVSMTGMLIIIR